MLAARGGFIGLMAQFLAPKRKAPTWGNSGALVRITKEAPKKISWYLSMLVRITKLERYQ
jgi:hypothetical protein